MAYRLSYTPEFLLAFDNCLDYLLYYVGGTGNAQAAKKFLEDFKKAEQLILEFPLGFTACDDLSMPDEQRIHFARMQYKLFYHLDGDTVVVDLICHDLQDYKNLL